jgi:hypothetical protein
MKATTASIPRRMKAATASIPRRTRKEYMYIPFWFEDLQKLEDAVSEVRREVEEGTQNREQHLFNRSYSKTQAAMITSSRKDRKPKHG